MVKQMDLRVQKSKRLIKDTFLNLMEKKGYKNITITDIAAEAQINRKTFYFHYESIDKLYNDISDECLSLIDFSTLLSTLQIDLEHSNFLSMAVSTLEQIKLQKETFRILMNDTTNNYFNERLKFFLSETLNNTTRLSDYASRKNIPFPLIQNIYSSLYFEIVRWWVNQEDILSKEAIDLMMSLFSDSILEAMGIQFIS